MQESTECCRKPGTYSQHRYYFCNCSCFAGIKRAGFGGLSGGEVRSDNTCFLYAKWAFTKTWSQCAESRFRTQPDRNSIWLASNTFLKYESNFWQMTFRRVKIDGRNRRPAPQHRFTKWMTVWKGGSFSEVLDDHCHLKQILLRVLDSLLVERTLIQNPRVIPSRQQYHSCYYACTMASRRQLRRQGYNQQYIGFEMSLWYGFWWIMAWEWS